MRFTLIIAIISLSLVSCKQNPKACLDLDEAYEVGREYRLNTCSENYEFIAWDFGLDESGFIGDSIPHTFQNIGERTVRIEAFSRGAYNSDEAVQQVRVSRRKVDYVEIIGSSDYTRFKVEFKSGLIDDFINFEQNTVGTFTEDSPFVGQIWGNKDWVLKMEPIVMSLEGRKNSNNTILVNQDSKNFRYLYDNPAIYEGNGIIMKMYWRFDD